MRCTIEFEDILGCLVRVDIAQINLMQRMFEFLLAQRQLSPQFLDELLPMFHEPSRVPRWMMCYIRIYRCTWDW